jgi:hypothetical protein
MQYSKCYVINGTCLINGDYPEINILNFYFNCIQCNIDNIRPPRSANTETFICQEICDLSGGTTTIIITPPHPVWTDAYGVPVTQLNMITLGGINGLNN